MKTWSAFNEFQSKYASRKDGSKKQKTADFTRDFSAPHVAGAVTHITDGRDGRGVEWTKCGLNDRDDIIAGPTDDVNEFCPRCVELDG